MVKWLIAGEINYKEHLIAGLENTVNAFAGAPYPTTDLPRDFSPARRADTSSRVFPIDSDCVNVGNLGIVRGKTEGLVWTRLWGAK